MKDTFYKDENGIVHIVRNGKAVCGTIVDTHKQAMADVLIDDICPVCRASYNRAYIQGRFAGFLEDDEDF